MSKTQGIKASGGAEPPVPITTDSAPTNADIVPLLQTVPEQAIFMGGAFKSLEAIAKSTWLQAPSLISVPLSATSGTVVLNLPLYGDMMSDAARVLMLLHSRFIGKIHYRVTLFGASTILGGLEVGLTIRKFASPTVNDLRVIKGDTIPANGCQVYTFTLGPIVPSDGIMRNFFRIDSDNDPSKFTDPAEMDWSDFPHFVLLQNVPLQSNITAESLSQIYLRVETMMDPSFQLVLDNLQHISHAKTRLVSTTTTSSLVATTNRSKLFSLLIGKNLSTIFNSDRLYLSMDGIYNIGGQASITNPTLYSTKTWTHFVINAPWMFDDDSRVTVWNKYDIVDKTSNCFEIITSSTDNSEIGNIYRSLPMMAIKQKYGEASGRKVTTYFIGATIINENSGETLNIEIDPEKLTGIGGSFDDVTTAETFAEKWLSSLNDNEISIQRLAGLSVNQSVRYQMMYASQELNGASYNYPAEIPTWKSGVRLTTQIEPTYLNTGYSLTKNKATVYVLPFIMKTTHPFLTSSFLAGGLAYPSFGTLMVDIPMRLSENVSLDNITFSYSSYVKAPSYDLFTKVPENTRRIVFTQQIPGSVNTGIAVDGTPTVYSLPPVLFPTMEKDEVLLFNLVSPNNNQTLFTVCWDHNYSTFYFTPVDQTMDFYATYNAHDVSALLFTNPVTTTIGNVPRISIGKDFLSRVVSGSQTDTLILNERRGPRLTTITRSMLTKYGVRSSSS